jgi:hypothetical protein
MRGHHAAGNRTVPAASPPPGARVKAGGRRTPVESGPRYRSWRGLAPVLAAALLLAGSALAFAQQWGGRGGFREPIRWGLPQRQGGVDRGFTFCRLAYTSDRREPGGSGWRTDYPNADVNFALRLSQMTHVRVARFEDGTPAWGVVEATQPELFECPFLFASDVGTMRLNQLEELKLREYLLKGGFLWVDDFWGDAAWRQWESQILRVLPEHTIADVPLDHRLFSMYFVVKEVPQIANIGFWRRSGGGTSERGMESAVPNLRAIFDDHGRIMVLMSHNTDIADGWEREGEDPQFFYLFSPISYGIGINIALWMLMH